MGFSFVVFFLIGILLQKIDLVRRLNRRSLDCSNFAYRIWSALSLRDQIHVEQGARPAKTRLTVDRNRHVSLAALIDKTNELTRLIHRRRRPISDRQTKESKTG